MSLGKKVDARSKKGFGKDPAWPVGIPCIIL